MPKEKIRTFRRGIHPLSHKKPTENVPLGEISTPETVYINVAQHLGAPALPVVAEGDRVKVGTLIAAANGFVSANVHSSVSGTVKKIASLPGANGISAKHILIENDGLYESELLPALEDPSKEEIAARVRDAGIVGMGGASFPAHVKLAPKNPVDTLLINAAECEPYITCDYRLLLDYPDDFLKGVELLKKAADAKTAYICIEVNKPDAVKKLRGLLRTDDIRVVPLKVKYPQGAEKQLIYAATRRKVPCGGLPSDVGVIVFNAHTAYSAARAVCCGEACVRRIMTVAGGGVEKVGNYWVRVGVPYQHIYNETRGCCDENAVAKILSGGPMMGIAQPSLKASVAKGSSAILFLTEKQTERAKMTACINCACCATGCPMNLMPMQFEAAVKNGDFALAKKLGVLNCLECGVCTYNCPAKRPLIQAIRLAKKTIRENKL
ncbi:MAG: electron transport complex subunit RsxC [Clostridiales bacterium]|jgi:electron transport complex protein RnfC|nr:electron transport complex subunit RsxC [Clostridiales bacterium]